MESLDISRGSLPIEICPSNSTPNSSSPSFTYPPLVQFDLPFFKAQVESFCNKIYVPIPSISSNPLKDIEQLLSPSKSPKSSSFKIKPALLIGEVSLFERLNEAQKWILTRKSTSGMYLHGL